MRLENEEVQCGSECGGDYIHGVFESMEVVYIIIIIIMAVRAVYEPTL